MRGRAKKEESAFNEEQIEELAKQELKKKAEINEKVVELPPQIGKKYFTATSKGQNLRS